MPQGRKVCPPGDKAHTNRPPTDRVRCSRKFTRQQPVPETQTEDRVTSHKASRIQGEQHPTVLRVTTTEGDGDTVAGTRRGALCRPLEKGTVAVSAGHTLEARAWRAPRPPRGTFLKRRRRVHPAAAARITFW